MRRDSDEGNGGRVDTHLQQALSEELGRDVPVANWHVARDGFAEAVNSLAVRSQTASIGERSSG